MLENILKVTSAEKQRITEKVQQKSKVEWLEKADEEERRRVIERLEAIKKENEIQKKHETEQLQRQKREQDAATCKALLEECGMQFFVEYYLQIKRLPIRDVTVSNNYLAERETRLTAAKKIFDSGLNKYALGYIIKSYGDILPSETIDQAQSILNEIENDKGESK